jgi:peptidoglycan/LPS O-acetylase OafA/YrhL
MGRSNGWFAACFEKRPGDNPWLDLLRTLAIVLVLLRHGQRALLQVTDPVTYGPFDIIALNGWIGVDLFFVLSGYLLGAKLLSPRGGDGVALYLQDRALRILPAYLAVLALVLLGVFPGHFVSNENLTWRVVYHLLFLQDVLPSDINVVLWSLGVEVKFYIALPFLAWLLLRLDNLAARLGLIALFVCAGVALRSGLYLRMDKPMDYLSFWQHLRSPFYVSLDALLLGTGVALLTTAGKLISPAAAAPLMGALLTGGTLWLVSADFMGTITLWDVSGQTPALALLFAGTVWAAASLRHITLKAEPLFRMGARLSYSVYLVHFPLLPLALHLGDVDTMAGTWVFWTSFLGMSLILAMLIHLGIERPFLAKRWRRAGHHKPTAPAR